MLHSRLRLRSLLKMFFLGWWGPFLSDIFISWFFNKKSWKTSAVSTTDLWNAFHGWKLSAVSTTDLWNAFHGFHEKNRGCYYRAYIAMQRTRHPTYFYTYTARVTLCAQRLCYYCRRETTPTQRWEASRTRSWPQKVAPWNTKHVRSSSTWYSHIRYQVCSTRYQVFLAVVRLESWA